jgi:hypothetical protein
MARLGESNRALAVLSECIDRGFSSVRVLERNSWLDSLRSSVQFSELLKRSEERFVEAAGAFCSAGGPTLLGYAA